LSRRSERKMTVEECIAFSLSSLVRDGVFRAPPGTLCNSNWTDSDQQETLRIYFSWDLTPTGQSFLRINERANKGSKLSPSVSAQSVEIVQTSLHFGSRRWFVCPGLANRTACHRRARFLYLPPDATRFCCRRCHDLVHLSAQRHDKRVDALLRLPLSGFQSVLTNGSFRQRLLTVQACTVALRRLRRKAVSSGANGSSGAGSPASDFGNNSGNRLGTEHPGTPSNTT
jgi:hypothetical protein